MNTASALKSVSATLYGTSSYNKDFSSALCTPHIQGRHSIQSIPIQCEMTDTLVNPTLQELNIQPAKDEKVCGKCKFCAEENHLQESEGYQNQDKDLEESCSCCESNDEECCSDESEQAAAASNVTTHGHMICISRYTNILPRHVIVSSLSELPSHFRRVTTKYTRNRCPLLPCRVPHYLLRKHQLLPSVITSLPSRKRSGQLPSATNKKRLISKDATSNYYYQSKSGEKSAKAEDRQLSATVAMKDAQTSAMSKYTAMNCHAKFTGSGEKSATPKDGPISIETKLAGENRTVAAKDGKGDDSCLPHLFSGREASKSQWMELHDGRASAIYEHQKFNGRHHNHHNHPLAGKVTTKAATEGAGVNVKDTIVLPQQLEVKGHVQWHSHLTQHLGQRFKTEAHTR